jgi:radical SAM superfamily enzyme YgiQ (UPF0313 family)
MIIGGVLKGAGYEVVAYDGMIDKKNGISVEEIIKEKDIRYIIFLTGIVSWEEDICYLRDIKRKIRGIKIIATGDIFFDDPVGMLLTEKDIDAIILDFTGDGIIKYIMEDYDNARGMVIRGEEKVDDKRERQKPAQNTFDVATPVHELFLDDGYRFPFVRHYPYTTVITTFGCPFKCKFCIGSVLGFKARSVESILSELRFISKELRIREIFFMDLTFGLPKRNVIEICNAMISEKMKIGWTCYTRADVISPELVELYKKAGCHTIMMGVESGDDEILKLCGKGLTRKQIKDAFKICKEAKIETVATFIIGLPDDNYDTCLKSIDFALELDCDYASFNVAVPRQGTEMRKRAIEENLINAEDIVFDHSGNSGKMRNASLSEHQVEELRRMAIRKFYLRPGYILRRLMGIRTITQFKEHVSEAFTLIFLR